MAPSINAETISAYVGLLERMFIVEPQQPWAPALRSRARLRTTPKQRLVDPALAAAVLGAGESQLRRDLKTLGVLLLESAVIHDLAVLAAPLGGEVRHYRDNPYVALLLEDLVHVLDHRASVGCRFHGEGVAELRAEVPRLVCSQAYKGLRNRRRLEPDG